MDFIIISITYIIMLIPHCNLNTRDCLHSILWPQQSAMRRIVYPSLNATYLSAIISWRKLMTDFNNKGRPAYCVRHQSKHYAQGKHRSQTGCRGKKCGPRLTRREYRVLLGTDLGYRKTEEGVLMKDWFHVACVWHTYLREWTGSILVYIMAEYLLSANPLSVWMPQEV